VGLAFVNCELFTARANLLRLRCQSAVLVIVIFGYIEHTRIRITTWIMCDDGTVCHHLCLFSEQYLLNTLTILVFWCIKSRSLSPLAAALNTSRNFRQRRLQYTQSNTIEDGLWCRANIALMYGAQETI